MFSITDEEKAAFEAVEAKQTEIHELTQQFRNFGYNMSAEERQARTEIEETIQRMKAEITAMQETDLVLLFGLKTEANKWLAEKVPGSPAMWLTLMEDLVSNLDTPNGERAKVLAKGLVLRTIAAFSDTDIQAARAGYTAGRYKALITAGLPAELAGQILVAEASRPIGFPSASGSSKK